MKHFDKAALSLLLRDCLKSCIIYWIVFCLVDYVHIGHVLWVHNLVLAAAFSLVISALRGLFLERNGGIRKAKQGE